MEEQQKKRGEGSGIGNIRNWANNQGDGTHTTEKKNKKKITISALKTYII